MQVISRTCVRSRYLLEDSCTALRPLAEGKNLVFESEAPPHDLVARTDRRALSQILINLTNNAIKFTEQGSVRLVFDQDQQNGQRLTRISIVDTGIGIRHTRATHTAVGVLA
jgi:two-component system sensor histidine kinase/response regulator